MLKLDKHQKYALRIKDRNYRVVSSDSKKNFTEFAAKRGAKLYVVSRKSSLIYVGITTRSMSSRLRGGMKASGKNGYYGYSWRKKGGGFRLDIWGLIGCPRRKASLHLETIEAETVLLYRSKSGQWPSGQTEIHFHKSSEFHRSCARRIVTSIMH